MTTWSRPEPGTGAPPLPGPFAPWWDAGEPLAVAEAPFGVVAGVPLDLVALAVVARAPLVVVAAAMLGRRLA